MSNMINFANNLNYDQFIDAWKPDWIRDMKVAIITSKEEEISELEKERKEIEKTSHKIFYKTIPVGNYSYERKISEGHYSYSTAHTNDPINVYVTIDFKAISKFKDEERRTGLLHEPQLWISKETEGTTRYVWDPTEGTNKAVFIPGKTRFDYHDYLAHTTLDISNRIDQFNAAYQKHQTLSNRIVKLRNQINELQE